MEIVNGKTLLFFSLFCCSLSLTCAADFFDSEEIVSFRLEAPITQLRSQRGSKTEELLGKVYYTTKGGAEETLNVKIEARGNFRRKRTTCYFLPYWINFKKSEVKGTPFAGLDKVKVVTHCNQGRTTYEDYMYNEYLIYKTYNLITDSSFRVRLTSINYINTDKKKNQDEGAFGAFFLEHTNSLEERFSVKQVNDKFVLPSRYDLQKLCVAEMFQFFIGNTDFSYFASEDECCHNAKIFAPMGETTGLFPVPYDFDMSGLVDAPYSQPNPNFPITSIKHRLYRGIEVNSKIWADTVKLYHDKKDEIYELWENFEPLKEEYRAKSLDFIDEFYSVFNSTKKSKLRFTAEMRSFDALEKGIKKDIDKDKERAEKEAKKVQKR